MYNNQNKNKQQFINLQQYLYHPNNRLKSRHPIYIYIYIYAGCNESDYVEETMARVWHVENVIEWRSNVKTLWFWTSTGLINNTAFQSRIYRQCNPFSFDLQWQILQTLLINCNSKIKIGLWTSKSSVVIHKSVYCTLKQSIH